MLTVRLRGFDFIDVTIDDFTPNSFYLGVKSSYFTKDVSMDGLANGMYIVSIETETERLAQKMVKHSSENLLIIK